MCASRVAYKSFRLGKVASPNLKVLTQVAHDWETQPFVAIRTQKRTCEDIKGDDRVGEDIWTRLWKGTEKGCFFPEIDPLVGRTIPAEVKTYADW